MPSARIVEMIRKWADNGYKTAEIARLVKLTPQEVRDIIAAGHSIGNKAAKPEFLMPGEARDVPLFGEEDA